jgi:hypothetical protein
MARAGAYPIRQLLQLFVYCCEANALPRWASEKTEVAAPEYFLGPGKIYFRLRCESAKVWHGPKLTVNSSGLHAAFCITPTCASALAFATTDSHAHLREITLRFLAAL